jgi:hypothetical protein
VSGAAPHCATLAETNEVPYAIELGSIYRVLRCLRALSVARTRIRSRSARCATKLRGQVRSQTGVWERGTRVDRGRASIRAPWRHNQLDEGAQDNSALEGKIPIFEVLDVAGDAILDI